MTTNQENLAYSHIHEGVDGETRFVLHPENDELFTRTGKQVIEACRLDISIEVWFHERNSMFDHILRWINEKELSDKILGCYAVPRGIGIGLFFVPCQKTFDFDLADQLAKLSAQLVQGFNIGPVEIHQLPEEEMDRFIIPEAAIEIYRNAGKSHQTMAP